MRSSNYILLAIGMLLFSVLTNAACVQGPGGNWEDHLNGCRDKVSGLVWTRNQTLVNGGVVYTQGGAVAKCDNVEVFSDGSGRLPSKSEFVSAIANGFNSYNDVLELAAGGYNWTSTKVETTNKKTGVTSTSYEVVVPLGNRRGDGPLYMRLGPSSTISMFCVSYQP